MKAWELPEYVVVDSEGNVQKATVEDADVKFGYDLPDDKFRQPYMARQVKVSLFAEKLPALGYRTYALVPAEAAGAAGKGSNIASDDRHLDVYKRQSWHCSIKQRRCTAYSFTRNQF